MIGHTWVEITQTIQHPEEGHYETQVVKDAWDEPVYERRPVCNTCGADFDSVDEAGQHAVFEHGGGSYSVKNVQVDTIHHDAETKEVWVVDQAAWTETIVTGYQCRECGATK